MGSNRLNPREIALSLIVFLGLAVPFMPLPGDGTTRIDVRFQTSDMEKPQGFSTYTRRSICSLLSMSLDFDNPDTGEYTRIDCAE
jgi:hypothetical protein